MSLPGLSANFNEPQSNDPTSAPAIQIPQGAEQSPQAPMQQASQRVQGLAQALAQRKKKTGIEPTIRTPSTLAAAISAAKRARQSGHRFG